MTKQYWPMAKVKEKDGSIRTQATYDSCYSIKEALNTIAIWGDAYNFDIIEAWIDVKMSKPNYSERIEVKHCWVAKSDYFSPIYQSND